MITNKPRKHRTRLTIASGEAKDRESVFVDVGTGSDTNGPTFEAWLSEDGTAIRWHVFWHDAATDSCQEVASGEGPVYGCEEIMPERA